MSKLLWWRSLIPGFCGSILLTAQAQAQLNLTPDNTAGTQVETTGTRDRVVGGTRPQNAANLFHSFAEFNVREGRSVIFAAPSGVRNIFSRVTGVDPSDILGTLGTEGSASLFLMNPNGILFGKNARLDVGGSFVGTTANAIQFGTQGFFSTATDAPSPLLTISPSALFFNSFNPANPITSRGTLRVPNGQTLALIGGTVTLDGSNLIASGGQINLGAIGSGNIGLSSNLGGNLLTLSIPGTTTRSNITINGSNLNVNAGNGGSLVINADNLTISGGSQLRAGIATGQGSVTSRAGNITLDATGIIRLAELIEVNNDLAGGGIGKGGDIQVAANSLLVTGGAQFNVATFGQGDSGNIVINVRDRLSFDGFVPDANGQDGNASGASSFAGGDAKGQGGNIQIAANSVSVTNAASIATFSFGSGDAGSIQIRANGRINFDGAIPIGRSSNALSFIFNNAGGKGGNLNISGDSIELNNGAEILAFAFRGGNAGQITLTARDRVAVNGVSASRQAPSAVRSQVINGEGRSGNVSVSAASIELTNGGQINTSTEGQGNGGNVILTARDRVSVDGVTILRPDGQDRVFRSEIKSGVRPSARGQGGNIDIATGSLFIRSGGRIDSSVEGQGDGGNIGIVARDRVLLDGFSAPIFGFREYNPSGISSAVAVDAKGQGGNISIQVPMGTLEVTNGAEVLASTSGKGDSGNLTLSAQAIAFDGTLPNTQEGSSVAATAVFPAFAGNPGGRGQGGTVRVQATALSLRNGAQLFANTFREGNAGNILIDADRVLIEGSSADGLVLSGIFASVTRGATGQGGDIRLNLKDSLVVRNGAGIFASTDGRGNAGNISIDADRVVIDGIRTEGRLLTGILAGVSQGATGQGGDVRINVKDALTIDAAGVFVDTQGDGNAGDIAINAGNGNVLLRGGSRNSLAGLFARTQGASQGRGGNITIQADDIRIENAAAVNTVTRNNNPGGRVTIAANTLSATQGGQVITTTTSSGRAGDISLNVRDQTIFAGSAPTPVNLPQPTFQADDDLADRSPASGLFANTLPNSTGQGGNVDLATGQLSMQQGAQITAASRGTGNSGNLTITAPQVALSNAQILAETVSSRGGNITLQNLDRLQLDNSTISASTATGEAGSLQVNAGRGLLQLRDSSLSVATTQGGRAGNLTINADRVNLQGSEVTVNSTGSGRAGGLTAVAETIVLNGRSSFNARTEAGQGADISLRVAGALRLLGNSSISASTEDGQGGTVRLNPGGELANLVELSNRSSLSAEATGRGSAGSVSINTRQLRLRNQAGVAVSSANGAAGELAVIADNIFLDQSSALNAETIRGSGANIRLQVADTLRLRGNSTISASTQAGTGGSLSLNQGRASARQVILSGSRLLAEATGTGNAGSVEINAAQVSLRDNSRLSVEASGTGNAGSVEINADQVALQSAEISAATRSGRGGGIRFRGVEALRIDQGAISASTQSGQGGDITLQSVGLVEMNHSSISASTRSGRGGDILLQDVDSLRLGNSSISASTTQGVAGSLTVKPAGTIALDQGSSLSVGAVSGGTARNLTLGARRITIRDSSVTVSSPEGRAGSLQIAAAERLNLSAAVLSANTGANDPQNSSKSTGDIRLNAPLVLMNDGSSIETNADLRAQGGNINIDTDFLVALGNSDITANASGGAGGQITINAPSVIGTEIRQQRTPSSDITAISELDPTLNGQVQLNTLAIDPSQGLIELPTDVVDRSQQAVQRCSAAAQSTSQFVVTGRGGLPPSPTDPRGSEMFLYSWASLSPDAVSLRASQLDSSDRSSTPILSAPDAIAEAQGWMTNAQGKLVLTAQPAVQPETTLHRVTIASPQCR